MCGQKNIYKIAKLLLVLSPTRQPVALIATSRLLWSAGANDGARAQPNTSAGSNSMLY
jgi:hypothetical protein